MLARVARRLLWVFALVAAAFFAAAGIAALAVWLPYAGQGTTDDALPAVLSPVIRLGSIAVLVGVAVPAFMYLSRGWPAAPATFGNQTSRTRIEGWLVWLRLYLVGVPVMLVAAAAPSVEFVRRHTSLFDDQLGSLLLMVPLFELLETSVLLVGFVALLFLFWSNSSLFPRGLVALTGVQLGFVLMALAAIDLHSAVGPFVAIVPAMQEHNRAVEAVVRYQTWLVVATAAWIPLLIVSPRTAVTFAVRPRTGVARVTDFERGLSAPSAVGAPSGHPEQPSAVGEAPKFLIRARFFAGFLGSILEAVDLNAHEKVVARLAPIAGHMRLISSAGRGNEVATATRDRYFTPWPSYVVTAYGNQLLGRLRKLSIDEWRILDKDGHEIGSIERQTASIGRAEYVARIGEAPVCSLAWSNILRPELVLDCSPDVRSVLDWRFALTCALAVFVDICPTE
jgi:hypothetical protein